MVWQTVSGVLSSPSFWGNVASSALPSLMSTGNDKYTKRANYLNYNLAVDSQRLSQKQFSTAKNQWRQAFNRQAEEFDTGVWHQVDQFNKSMAESRRQFDALQHADRTKVQRLMADAEKAGVHPLSVLGMQSAGSAVGAPSGGGMSSGGYSPQSPGSSGPGGFSVTGTNPNKDDVTVASALASVVKAMAGTMEIQRQESREERDRAEAREVAIAQAVLARDLARLDADPVGHAGVAAARAAGGQTGAVRRPQPKVEGSKKPNCLKTPFGCIPLDDSASAGDAEDEFGGLYGEGHGLARLAKGVQTMLAPSIQRESRRAALRRCAEFYRRKVPGATQAQVSKFCVGQIEKQEAKR